MMATPRRSRTRPNGTTTRRSLFARLLEPLVVHGFFERWFDRPVQSRRRISFEQLEHRSLLATITWDGGAGTFNWNDANNWSTNTLPGTADDAVIPDLVGTPTITSTASVAVRNLTSAEHLAVTSGSVSVLGAAQLSAGLTESGGTFFSGSGLASASTINIASGTTLVVSGTPASGLVSLWHAEGNALDAAGTNSGTLTGGTTFATGRIGQSYSMDGIDDWVATSQTFPNDQSFTVAAWVYWNGNNGQSLQEIFSWWNTTDPVPNRMFLGTAAPGTGQGPIRFGDDWNSVPVNLPINQWVHIAATYDGASNDRKVFLDGVEVASRAGTAEARFAATLAIGRQGNAQTAGEYWNGLIDEPSVFSRVLTAGEISSLVAGGTYTQTAGTTIVNGTLAASGVTVQAGTLQGTGTVTGPVTNQATVAPGNSPGCLTVNGNYAATSTSTLDIEIAGTAQCAEYDSLHVNGTVTLAGTLNVSLLGGFDPAAGDVFTIIENNNEEPIVGTFTGLPEGAKFHVGGQEFQISYAAGSDGNDVVLFATHALVVTNANDSGAGSLRQAIISANGQSGLDEIVFAANVTGTITLTSGQLAITDDLQITGPGASALAISGNNASRVFDITAGDTVTISGLTIRNGNVGSADAAASYGGGIRNLGVLTVSNSVITANSASRGGGIYNEGSLTVDATTVSQNSVNITGGGIENFGPASSTTLITRSLIASNTAAFGGGLGDDSGVTTVINSTVHGNSATGNGGGLVGSTFNLTNVTISGNTAPFGGGIQVGSGLTMTNTVVAGNTATSSGPDVNVVAGSASGTFNLIGNGTGTVGIVNGVSGNQVGTAGSPIDARLGPLADNFGATKTLALLVGSPATNAGSAGAAPATDQRGVGRVGAPDIGAFEADRNYFLVTNTSNTGANSLRQALTDANATANLAAGADVIQFNIPGAGPHTITPASALPTLASPVVIDGYTQPGASANTLASGNDNALKIVVNGASAGTGVSGFTITGGDSVVRGLAIGGFNGYAVRLSTGDNNRIEGNYLGTNVTGTAAATNASGGIRIESGAQNNVIGGTTPAARNLISGNGSIGIFLVGTDVSGNAIQGNYIGTNKLGTGTVPNATWGVIIQAGPNNTVGGDVAGAGNLISGNSQGGVAVFATGANGNTIQGNTIGLDVGGSLDLGNAFSGVYTGDGSGFTTDVNSTGFATGTVIGGTTALARNVVSGNNNYGIWLNGSGATGNVVQGNYVGTSASGSAAVGNSLEGILIQNSSGNTIGGSVLSARNLVSGNISNGVKIAGAGATNNIIAGNYIGTDITGTIDRGNTQDGIRVDAGATNNTIGGESPGSRNLISGNDSDGIEVVDTIDSNGTPLAVSFAGDTNPGRLFSGTVSSTADLSFDFFTAYSDTMLFVTFRVLDDFIDAQPGDAAQPFFNDSVELFIDGDRVANDYGPSGSLTGREGFQLISDTLGNRVTVAQGFTNADWSVATSTIAGGYTIEFRVPLALIDVQDGAGFAAAGPGSKLRFTAAIVDNDALVSTQQAYGMLWREGSATTGFLGGEAVWPLDLFLNDGTTPTSSAPLLVSAPRRGNTIQGNLIGTNAAGTVALANTGGGINVNAAAGNLIGGTTAAARNVVSGNTRSGILVSGTSAVANLVQGDYIGVNAAGTTALGNGDDGISIFGGAAGNTVGGAVAGTGNVISGNARVGVWVSGGASNLIAGNFIGTAADGSTAIGNGLVAALPGVMLQSGSTNNTIGGTVAAARNVISANRQYGVLITGSGTSANAVLGNYIGTDVTGTLDRGNTLDGVRIESGAANNTIGGSAGGARNVISGNDSDGVEINGAGTTGNVVANNYIGTPASGTIDMPVSWYPFNTHARDIADNNQPSATNGINTFATGKVGAGLSLSAGGFFEIPHAANLTNQQFTLDAWVQPGGAGPNNDTLGSVIIEKGLTNTSVSATLWWSALDNRFRFGFGDISTELIASSGTFGTGTFHHVAGTYDGATFKLYVNGTLQGQMALAKAITYDSSIPWTIGSTRASVRGAGFPRTWNGFIDEVGIYNHALTATQIQEIVTAGTAGRSAIVGNSGNGVLVTGAPGNTIGLPGAGNVISGNRTRGVRMTGAGSASNSLQGNLIGTTADGAGPVGNGGQGILVDGGATLTRIGTNADGTTDTSEGNVVSGNVSFGIQVAGSGTNDTVIAGNYIGTNANGDRSISNGLFFGILMSGGAQRTRIGTDGLKGARNAAERNLISGNVIGIGIQDSGTTGTVIAGNWIGLNAAGNGTVGNSGSGIELKNNQSLTRVGTNADGAGDTDERNVISGNFGHGIIIRSGANANVVAGNYIGTDPGGSLDFGNAGDGVNLVALTSGEVGAAFNNVIGGTTDTHRNVISGNNGDGIDISGVNSNGNVVIGNFIGTHAAGTSSLANSGIGVRVGNGPLGTIIGGTTTGARNVISGNSQLGVSVSHATTVGTRVLGNYIGTDVNGTADVGNAMSGVIVDQGAIGTQIGVALAELVVNDWGNTRIKQFIPTLNVPDQITTPSLQPLGVAVAADGSRFVVSQNGTLWRFSATGFLLNTVATGLGDTRNVTIGPNGDIFVASVNNNSIFRFNGVTLASMGTFISGLNGPVGLNFGPDGNLYVTETDFGSNGRLLKFNGTTGAPLGQVGSQNLRWASSPVWDAVGNIYIGERGGNTILKLNGTTGQLLQTLVSGGILQGPEYLAIGPDGRLYVSAIFHNSVQIYDPNTGQFLDYAISPTAGLNLPHGIAFTQQVVFGNVVSGNNQHGVYLTGAGTSQNVVAGNYIGTDKNGTAPIANTWSGVAIAAGAKNNRVGTNADGHVDTAERNVVSGNALVGVWLTDSGTDTNVVAGNYVGVTKDGDVALANGWEGIALGGGAKFNRIGTNSDGVRDDQERNVVSGNLLGGVTIGRVFTGPGTEYNVVAGNYIGTDWTGNVAIANSLGVSIESGAANNTIGGTAPTSKNVVSGNSGDGIKITGAGTAGNEVLGNYIGTNQAGTANLGNAQDGISVLASAGRNYIGATAPDLAVASENTNNFVRVSGITGSLQATISNGIGGLVNPRGLVFGPDGNVYVSSTGTSDSILRYDGVTGAFLGAFVPTGSGGLDNPHGITFGPDGHLYVASGGNKVLKYHGTTGAFISTFVPAGTGGLTTPRGVAFGPDGNLYVGSVNTVKRYDGITGAYLDDFVTTGSGGLTTAFGVTFGPDRNLYVSSFGTNQVLRYDGTTGASLGVFASGSGLVNPHGLTFGPDGHLYVSNDPNHSVLRFNGTTGAFIDTFVAPSTGGITFAAYLAFSPSRYAGNLISGNNQDGIELSGGTGNIVQANRIGTNFAGSAPIANATGIRISSASNTIGTSGDGVADTIERNIISGNSGDGILIVGGNSNRVAGNYVGTNTDGTAAVPNNVGVAIFFATGNVIGTDGSNDAFNANERNVISGNANRGVILEGANVLAGNYIGTDATGTAALGNFTGVQVTGTGARVGTNADGIADAEERNVISGNTGVDGGIDVRDNTTTMAVIAGNYVGLNAAGTATIGNVGPGITMKLGADNIRVGTNGDGVNDVAERNVIAGNSVGVRIMDANTTANVVAGNYIGTDPSGTLDFGNATDGVFIGSGATANTIGGTADEGGNLISGNNRHGVLITGAGTSSNLIEGNWIGLDATGGTALSNADAGVAIQGGTANQVGGASPGAGNVIAGNSHGVTISNASGNQVQGNFIGTDWTGRLPVGSMLHAVRLEGGTVTGTLIGGTAPGAGNVLANAEREALLIFGADVSANVVQGNLIGLDASGSTALNNRSAGIHIGIGSHHNVIGGAIPGAGNVISGNQGNGILISDAYGAAAHDNVLQGNFIGTDIFGAQAIPNNGGIGISGAFANVIGQADAGNLISGNSQFGLSLNNSPNNVVRGNRIGTRVTGDEALANLGPGLTFSGDSGANTIGGYQAGQGNLISGNDGDGIRLAGHVDGTTVIGNLIGTDVTGTVDVGNTGVGARLTSGPFDGVQHVTIGGDDDDDGDLDDRVASRNVISGNGQGGILIEGAQAGDVTIAGNFIGVDAIGNLALPNTGNGITIAGSNFNIVGGTTPGAENRIAFNSADGVRIENGGAQNGVAGNSVRHNAIHSNAGLGINLVHPAIPSDGPTANDVNDADSGPNGLQNFPVLTAVGAGSSTRVVGVLGGAANTTFDLDFFGNLIADPSGFGEGQRYLGSTTVTTDGNGSGAFNVLLANVTTFQGDLITATATDVTLQNTSEFSAAFVAVSNQPPSIEAGNVVITIVDPATVGESAGYGIPTTSIDEGDLIHLDGLFTNADANDVHTITINWGDGSPVTTIPNVTAGVRGFSSQHLYRDDDPTITDHDVYRLEIVVTDQDGGAGRATIDLTVTNRPIVLDSLSVDTASALEGDMIHLTGGFTDPGDDYHSLVINWGDGSASQTVALPRGARSFSIPHVLLDDDDATLGQTRIQIRLTDDDGAQVQAETSLNVDNVTPGFVINNLTPLPVVDELVRLQALITDPGTRDTHSLEWQAFAIGSPQPLASGTGASFQFTPPRIGTYRVTLSGADDDGGSSTATPLTLVAANSPPRMTASDLALAREPGIAISSVQEGEPFFLSGSFRDSLLETHVVSINWGDGTPLETIPLSAGQLSFGPIPHRFADDNPTGTSVDPATIQVSVVDQYNASAQASRGLEVLNVAPRALIVDDDSSPSQIKLKAQITDPGTDALLFAWRIRLLDGSLYDPQVPLNTDRLTFTRPSSGSAAGPLRIEFTATDDDLGLGSDAIVLVSGTDASETFTVAAVGQTLTISVGATTFTNVPSENRVLIEAMGGNDVVTVPSTVMTSFWIDGGPGSDRLTGGGGSDVLSDGDTAEEGDDEFNDTLIGGDGDDTIVSLAGDDVLDGGLGNETYGIVLHSSKTLIDNGGIDTIDFSRTLRSTTGSGGAQLGIAFDLGFTGSPQTVDGFGDQVLLQGTFENAVGTRFNDVLAGNAQDNRLFGGVGNDTLGGGVDPDVAVGGGGPTQGILGGNDTVDGGDGNDLIFGGSGNESLAGGAGNDTVVGGVASGGTDNVAGGDGDDLIFAGVGLETILGGAGNDTIQGAGGTLGTTAVGGAGGNDMLDGGDGNDLIFAGAGDQSIAGGAGNDTMLGGTAPGGMDTVAGGDGDDLIFAGTGLESIAGGAGNDTINGGTAPGGVAPPTGGGDDTIDGGDGNDLIFAGLGNDSLIGGAGGDTLVGGNNVSRQDTLIGGDGEDLIFAGLGNDSIVGGAGSDTINAATAPAGVTIPARGGNDLIDGGDGNDLIFAGLGNDTLVGGAGSDTLVGGNNASQQDSILGGDGGDLIFAGLGNDTIVGGAGNDTINAATAPNGVVVPGRGGNDLVDGGDGNDLIFAGLGNDTLVGGTGNDTLVGGNNPARQDSILGGDGGDLIFAGLGNDTIVGGAGNDTINATAPAGITVPARGGNDLIDGGDGNDLIFGGIGLDSIAGGSGDDTIGASQAGSSIIADDGNDLIFAGLGNDTIVGGAGNDTIRGAGGTLGGQPVGTAGGHDSLVGGDGDDLIFAGVGIDSLAGGQGHDTLVGGTGSASIAAGDGNDLIFAGLGNDSIVGGLGNDTIRGSGGTLDGQPAGMPGGNDSLLGDDGDDLIFAGVGIDTIAGGLGNDTLVGGAGSASIAAGDGNDLIFAGLGNDTIAGGVGNDTIQGAGGMLGGQSVGGATGHDTLLGEDGDDLIFGGLGNDSIGGGLGNDAIHTGDGNSTAVGGAGSDTIQAGLGTELIFGGESTGVDDPSATDQLIAVLDGSIALGDSTITIGTVVSQHQGFEQALLIGGDGDNLLTASAFAGQSYLAGGAGHDTLVAGPGHDTLEGGAGNDRLEGGTGEDTYTFGADAAGDDQIVEGVSNSGDTLDFGQFTTGVTVNLRSSALQAIDAVGRLRLSGLANVENIVGSPLDDTLIGNARDNILLGQGGRDLLDAGLGDDLVAADETRVVWLDFDSATDPHEHPYSTDERAAIQDRIIADFLPYNVTITQTRPTTGPYIAVRFNDTPIIGGRPQPGGLAERVDFRGLIRQGLVQVDVNGFLGTDANRLPPTSENFVAMSSTIAAHEVAHMYGLRHHDAFGVDLTATQADGIFRGTNPNQFNPVYPGPATAETTRGHLIASPASVGTTLVDALGNPSFGERERLKLAFMETGRVVAEKSDVGTKTGSVTVAGRTYAAQELGELTSLVVPGLAARAIDVVGTIELEATVDGPRSESDFYSFTGHAGDRVTVDLMSQVLRQRIGNSIDSMIRLYNSNGQKLGYFQSALGAFNDDGLEPTDSLLLSVPLPADGTYYVEVDSFQFHSPEFATYQPDFDVDAFCQENAAHIGCTDQDTGGYELLLYTVRVGNGAGTSGDTVLGGRGADRLIGASGNETFDYTPEDGDTLSDPSGERTFVDPNHAPELAAISNPTVSEGQTVTLTAVATDADEDELAYSLESVAGQSFPTGATIDSQTGQFSWRAPDNGTFSARVVATDPEGEQDDQVVTITVQNSNPTAGTDSPSFDENGAARVVAVLANDTDPAGTNDPLRVTAIDTTGTLGVVTLAGGQITYDPAGRFERLAVGATATDTFHYTVADDDGGSSIGTVTVTIHGQNDAPDAVDDRVETTRGVNTLIPVLANDVDVDGDTLAVSLGAVPSQGTVTLNANGTFTYKANGNAIGTDSFTYSISDGQGGNDTATVRITIEALHVFANFPGELSPGTATQTIAFSVRSTDFTFVNGKVQIGAWLKPGEGSSLDPDVVVIKTAGGAVVTPVVSSADTFSQVPASSRPSIAKGSVSLVSLSAGDYTATVKSQAGTSGAYRLDFFLAGDTNGADANGSRVVDTADGNVINRDALNALSTQSRYVLEADVDLNGKVTATDYQRWSANNRAGTTLNPLFLTLTTQEELAAVGGVLRTTASQVTLAGKTLRGLSVGLDSNGDGIFTDQAAVANSSGAFSFTVNLSSGVNTFAVRTSDGFGQKRLATLRIERVAAGSGEGEGLDDALLELLARNWHS